VWVGTLLGSVWVWVCCGTTVEKVCAYAHVRTYARGGGRAGSVRHAKKRIDKERHREREKEKELGGEKTRKKEKTTERKSE